jgi:DNA-binding NarL/FixJ family response regulator
MAVFSLIAAGHGTGQIAKELGISRKTVETHCEHIKAKLGYANAEALNLPIESKFQDSSARQSLAPPGAGAVEGLS